MRRREFIALLGGAAVAWPLAARAQQASSRKIGVLMPMAESDPEAQPRVAAVRQEFEKLGWVDGRNIRIEFRWTGDPDHMRAYATELIGLSPDVLLATSNPGLAALRRETRTVPIVFVSVADPVGSGFIESLAQPGGNITGFTNFEPSIGGKWLQLLKEIEPGVARAAVLFHPEIAANISILHAVQAAAPSLGVTLTPAGVHDRAEIEQALTAFAGESNGALVVAPNPVTSSYRELIIGLANNRRLPAVAAWKHFTADGGLMSYGIDPIDQYRRAVAYVDRILRGEKPGNLPVQAPTKFELVINLRTAKALGLDVPLQLQQRADEVIE
jgi:putative tryptophan/tyrosine transport system substrate-binding protein